MTLADRLARMREGAAKRIPPERRAIMERATDELRQSGILDRVIRPGDALPPFRLPNADGTMVASADLLARGPLVLMVFRGSW